MLKGMVRTHRIVGTQSLRHAVLLLIVAWSCAALADNEARLPDDARAATAALNPKPFKLTLGNYRYSEGADGVDANLRYRGEVFSSWVGFYRDADFGQQWRGGLERAFELLPGVPLSLQFSGQIASRGFLGGSVTLEYGEPFFVLAGYGRTNGKPYFNLNFDPNDSWTLGAGWRADHGLTAYLLAVRDNRSNPGQQNLHAVLRVPLRDKQRLTIDLQRKTGSADFGEIKDWALSLTYDLGDWALRLANDHKQNFSAINALRFSVGYRF